MKKQVFVIYVFIAVLLLCSILFIIKLDIGSWQNLDISRIENPILSSTVFDKNNEPAGTLNGSVHRIYVELDKIPDYVSLAFIAAEDTRFFEHSGIDIRRIFGALLHDVRTLSLSQGASTITQQLIKLTHLSSEKSLSRKAQEAVLALRLEKQMTKDEILEHYINTVYFGGGAYGIGAAAERYFQKNASQLNLAEAALLAGIIKSPSGYTPHIDMDAALTRQEYVLRTMFNEGFINETELDAALDTDIRLSEHDQTEHIYGWYFDEVIQEACRLLNIQTDDLLNGGYSIYTGLDTLAQKSAEETMYSDEIYPESSVQGALVAITPDSGEICAIVGGRQYTVQQGMNRATDAKRQPGSLIKPISTYAAAIEKYNYSPTSFLYDIQREYADGYMPGNASGNYHGTVTLREALCRSMNAATVDLADTVGIETIIAMATGFGITVDNSDNNLAFSLGSMTYGVTPLEMCTAYGVLANGGYYIRPHSIRKILDRNGRTVYEYKQQKQQAVSADTAYFLTDILMTAAENGTAKSLSALGIPIAGKTGTAGLTNHDTSDAWTAAYTPDIAIVVWIGKDNNSDGGMDSWVSGGNTAAPACAAMLNKIKDSLSGDKFDIPNGLCRLLIDRYSLEKLQQIALASSNTPGEYVQAELFRNPVDYPVSTIWEAPPAVTDLTITNYPGDYLTLRFTSNCDYSEYLIIRTTNNVRSIICTLTAPSGEALTYADSEADMRETHMYSVIPRNAPLYDLGITLTGPESNLVVRRPSGILNGITSLFEGSDELPDIESNAEPLF